jgi:hypothetical protein
VRGSSTRGPPLDDPITSSAGSRAYSLELSIGTSSFALCGPGVSSIRGAGGGLGDRTEVPVLCVLAQIASTPRGRITRWHPIVL